MSNFKDKLTSLLFEQEASSKGNSSPVVSNPGNPNPVPSPAPVVNGARVIDEGLLDRIEKEIRNANLPGPDYLELKEAAEEKSLIQDEPDEGKRWRQAFRNMKSFFPQAGVTKNKILEAIDYYIGIVDRELNVGLQQLEEARKKNVLKEQEESDRLGQEIAALEEQIKLKKHEKDEKDLKINESRSKYEVQEANFRRTLDYAKKMLQDDKNKINNCINE